MLPRYHPDLRENMPAHLSDPVSGIRRLALTSCLEVAVFLTEQGLAPLPSRFGSAGWKTRFLIAFTILLYYYPTIDTFCQQKTGHKTGFLRREKRVSNQ